MTRRPKRTYKAVTVAPSGAGYAVLLDSKPAKAGAAILTLPTAALADAVAEEWRGQGERVDTECMRLTAIAGGA